MENPTLPTIHLNGTSARTLMDGYMPAWDKLNEFIEAWERIEFNSRDYYVIDGAWDKAVEERKSHNIAIKHLKDYIEAIIMHIDTKLP